MIRHGRQEELKEHLEDDIVRLLCYRSIQGQITQEELEWMVKLLSSILSLPNKLVTHQKQETDTMAAVIVQGAEGMAFDEKYLDIAMGERDEYMGYAFVDEGEIKYGEMSLQNKSEVKEEIATTTNHPLILMFAKDLPTEESKQPFITLTKEDTTPLCVTFMDGDLQGFGSPESAHSMAWAAHQQYLMPKIIEYFTDCGEDLNKTYEKLNRAHTKSEILNNCFPGTLANGNVVILFSNGKCLSFYKGDKHKKYEWGETSLAFGYEAKPVEPAKPKGLGAHSKTNTKSSVPEVKKEDKKPDTAIADAMRTAEGRKTNLNHMIVPPPTAFNSNMDLEKFYRSFANPEDLPSSEEFNKMKASKQGIPVKVKSSLSNDSFNKLLSLGKFLLAPTDSKPPEKKDTKTNLTIPIIIIPKNELEYFKKLGDKIMQIKEDDGSGLIYKPETIIKLAEANKHISATDQLGYQMGLDEFEGNYEIWDDYIKNPVATKAILVQYMLERYKDKQALKQVVSNTKKAM